jgi:hypothetical protein
LETQSIFQKNQADLKWKKLSPYISDVGTRQFLMKSLYWEEPGQLAFRFNVAVLIKNGGDRIGVPAIIFEKPMLLSVVETLYFR